VIKISDSIRLKKDKTIKKEDYKNTFEYKFNKLTSLVPKKVNKLICIIFS